MPEIGLFALYRRLLMIVVGTYTVIRFLQFIWRWRAGGLAARGHERLLRHWVESSMARLRIRRFGFDAFQIALLTAILLYLLWLQVGRQEG